MAITPRGTAARVAAASAAVFAFWLVISGSFALSDMSLGLAISLALGAWAVLALWADEAPAVTPRELFALLWYLAGLSRQIFAAAAHLARVVIDPRLPIEPMLITRRTSLRQPVSSWPYSEHFDADRTVVETRRWIDRYVRDPGLDVAVMFLLFALLVAVIGADLLS